MVTDGRNAGGPPLVLPLREDAEGDLGGKGAGLVRAMRAGFAVPDGFVVTYRGFERHKEEAGIDGEASRPAAHRRIREAPLPGDVREAVMAALDALRPGPWAVRSSAACEDSHERSLAGQFATVLGAGDAEAVLDAIRACYASALPGRPAPDSPKGGGMAVVVQLMVHPAVAGILFSRDPLGGGDDVIIEAKAGTAEDVAAGAVTPERWRVARRGVRVLEGGTLLDAPALKRLVDLAIQAEERLGGPQDVEWAISHGGEVLVLQARPITALVASEEADLWTSANSQEALEQPVTPLTWTFLLPRIEEGRRRLVESLGVPDQPGDYLALFFGRPYFNVDYFRRFLETVPAAPVNAFDQLIFGGGGELAEFSFPLPPLSRLTFRLLYLVIKERLFARRKIERFLRDYPPRVEALARVDVGRLPDRGLLDHIDAATERMIEALTLHVLGTALAGAHYLLLGRFLKRLGLPEAHPEGTLLAARPGVKTAEAGHRLSALARQARNAPAIADAILAGKNFDAIRSVEGAGPFVAGFEQFLAEFGHRAAHEAELCCKRWSEDSSFPLGIVRAYLVTGRTADEERGRLLEEKETTRRRIEASLTASLLDRLLPLRLQAFRLHLHWAETYAPYRENLRFEGLKAIAIVRRTFLEIGRRLVERGVLAAPDDIFYLEEGEARAFLCGREAGGPSLRAMVSARRTERERWMAASPPKFVRAGRGVVPPDTSAPKDPSLIQGIPVSAGEVEGRVRICRQVEDGFGLQAGEILVARAAGPAWTPLFPVAGGIILEVGGVLSHSAVMAREYGIPCIVNAIGATTRLADGDLVRLDAARGVAWKEE